MGGSPHIQWFGELGGMVVTSFIVWWSYILCKEFLDFPAYRARRVALWVLAFNAVLSAMDSILRLMHHPTFGEWLWHGLWVLFGVLVPDYAWRTRHLRLVSDANGR